MGQAADARHRLVKMVKKWPMRPELYIDFLKACAAPHILPKSGTTGG